MGDRSLAEPSESLSGDDGQMSGRISGAIARAARNSDSGRQRRDPLPNVRSQFRADRARAIAQRDRARALAQQLHLRLEETRADLAAALARAEAAERSSTAPEHGG